MPRALMARRRPLQDTRARRWLQEALGGGAQARRAPAVPASPSLHLVHPALVAAIPPEGHWAICLPHDTHSLDLIFHGVPRGLHPYVFSARCADAGVPGLAAGRFRRQGSIVRVTLTDRRVILLIGKLGVSGFSNQLRRVCGWRCVVDAPACGPACVHQHRHVLVEAEKEVRDVIRQHGAGVPAQLPPRLRSGTQRGLRLGSWNVRKGIATSTNSTARPPLKALELLQILRSRKFDIVAVQEAGEGPQRVIQGDGYYTWYTDTRPGVPGHGLGFFVRECGLRARIAVGLPEGTCEHCLWIRVDGAGRTPDLYIANVYLPVAGAAGTTSSTYAAALDALREDTTHFSGRGEVILMGDFNTRVGRAGAPYERIGQHGENLNASQGGAHERANLLLDFLNAADMYVLNGRRPTAEPEWTRVQHLTGSTNLTQRSIIDYVIAGANTIANNWQGEGFQVLSDDLLGADHRLLQVDLAAWGTARDGNTRSHRRRVFRWNLDRILAGGRATVEERAGLLEAYGEALEGEVGPFAAYAQQCITSGMPRDEVADAVARAWGQAVTRAAHGTIGRRMIIPGVAKAWWDDELRVAVASRRACHARWVAQVSNGDTAAAEQTWREYLQLRRRCKQLATLKQRDYHKQLQTDLSRLLTQDPHMFWRRANTLLGKKGNGNRTRVAAAQDEAGRLHTNDAGIARSFQQHYANLASVRPSDLPLNPHRQAVEAKVQQAAASAVSTGFDNPFTADEVAAAIASLKNGKAVHDDGIPNELIKYGGDAMLRLVRTLFNVMLECETVPGWWRWGTIINLHKAGNPVDPGNYRGITLLSCIGKLFCRCISNRLATSVSLHEGQAGFREGRSCIDNIYTLSDTILQRAAERQLTYVFYLDVRKAFDSTWHDGMWSKLIDKGVSGKLWRTMRNMYAKTRSCVLVNGIRTEYFPIQRGTAQGCTLSPLLFDIFVDGLLEAVEGAGFGVAPAAASSARVGGLMFADDFAGMESSPQRLQQLINTVREYLQMWGLEANILKSAVVTYGFNPAGPNQPDPHPDTNTPTAPAASNHPNQNPHSDTNTQATTAGYNQPTSNPQTDAAIVGRPSSRDPRRRIDSSAPETAPPLDTTRSTAPSLTTAWTWGDALIPVKDSYRYLGVTLHSSCLWTPHVQNVIAKGRAAVAQYGKYLRSRRLSRHVKLVLYKQYVRPVLEYGSEVWWPTDTQSLALERVQLHAARSILGCFEGTATVAVRAELGLQPLAVRRRLARLRWYGLLKSMPSSRLPAAVYSASSQALGGARWQRVWAARMRADWEKQRAMLAAGGEAGTHVPQLDAFYAASGEGAFRKEAQEVVSNAADSAARLEMESRSTLQHLPHISLRRGAIQPYMVHPHQRGVGTWLKMKCRTGTLEVNALLRSRQQEANAACPLCGELESVTHFLISCPAFDERRERLFQRLRGAFRSEAAYQEFRGASDVMMAANVLSDLYWSRLRWLEEANAAVCDFLRDAWDDRQRYIA